MAFRPNTVIRRKILTLLNLWAETARKFTGKRKQKFLSMTKDRFLEMLGDNLTYDLVRPYVENDDEIQRMIGKFNRNTVELNDPDAMDSDEIMPDEDEDQDELPGDEDLSDIGDENPEAMPDEGMPPAEEDLGAAPPAEPTPTPAPPAGEDEETARSNRKSLIASMAARARRRRT